MMLNCRRMLDGSLRLVGDPDVECSKGTYSGFAAFAAVSVLVYPLAVPAKLFHTLRRAKRDNKLFVDAEAGNFDPHPSSAYLASMYQAYEVSSRRTNC